MERYNLSETLDNELKGRFHPDALACWCDVAAKTLAAIDQIPTGSDNPNNSN